MIITKYISTDFPNGEIIIKQFQKLLSDNAELSFDSLILRGDELKIKLSDNTNSQNKIAIIDQIISNFVPDLSYNIVDFPQITIFPTPENKSFLGTWHQLMQFSFSGTLTIGIPSNVEIFANVYQDTPSGEIRLYDSTNQIEICKITVTSKSTIKHTSLPTDNLWPRNSATLEIHAKVSNSNFFNYIICSSIIIK